MPELRQRDPRIEDKAFLAFVRRQRCCVCGAAPPVQAAHIRMASPANNKRQTGKGERPSDKWCTPLCRECHEVQHKMSEAWFWRYHDFDPFKIALGFYAEFKR